MDLETIDLSTFNIANKGGEVPLVEVNTFKEILGEERLKSFGLF